MSQEMYAGKRNDDDIRYGGGFSAEQIEEASRLDTGALTLESEDAVSDRLTREAGEATPLETFGGPTESQIARAEEILAGKASEEEEVPMPTETRAELNEKVKANLLTKIISSQISGDTTETARLQAMIDVLDARMSKEN